ncbi:MFS transporter [Actinoplanes couchii]|uniref:MFS transporter n=1 Tax=Actinoplanes couchii TaxID=403638 RepID=A0ABQ3XRV4_9ACTN|nr:MFS transporter [Actinoplanes couchii]MDR6318461.1 putative MFS family arabinose efflux permease [Actinoplanes couchii]GID61218.1 MFS transporter [Actinoplanes couchii]
MTGAGTLPAPGRRMTPARTFVFAVAAGMAVGNLYWAQPLIEVIASSLGVSSSSAATLVTVTQLGYALGIFLIVPLGDILDRRRLIPLILTVSSATLLGAAAAPSYGVLLAALGGVGLTTVGAQLLAPLASELAEPERRGRVVGAVTSGGLIGILLSRTVSGFVADLFGWRAIYVIAAVAALVLAAVLRTVIPPLEPREPVPYPRLLGSVFTTMAGHRAVLPTLAICAASFSVFSLFWTSLTYLLTAPPFSFSVSQIGLFGLAGLAGALAARRAGALHDRGWSVPATGVALTVLALSLGGAWAGGRSVVALIVVVVILDIAAQSVMVLGQTRLFALPGSAHSRLNTAFVVSNFLGGAVGSAIAGPLWAAGGWAAIMTVSLAIVGAGLIVWTVGSRRLADTGQEAIDVPGADG